MGRDLRNIGIGTYDDDDDDSDVDVDDDDGWNATKYVDD